MKTVEGTLTGLGEGTFRGTEYGSGSSTYSFIEVDNDPVSNVSASSGMSSYLRAAVKDGERVTLYLHRGGFPSGGWLLVGLRRANGKLYCLKPPSGLVLLFFFLFGIFTIPIIFIGLLVLFFVWKPMADVSASIRQLTRQGATVLE